VPNIKCLQLCADTINNRANVKILEMMTLQYCDTHNESFDDNIFKNTTNCNNQKKHILSSTLTTFYEKNILLSKFEKTKSFSKIKKDIMVYIKEEELYTKYELSFTVDRQLSCFGISKNTIIQNADIDNFVSHIIMYSPKVLNKEEDLYDDSYDESDNELDKEQIIKKQH
jgi:hypothetical protein